MDCGSKLESIIEKFIELTGCPLTKEELLRGMWEVYHRRLQCSRCGQIFGIERMNWTGMYYHPVWECEARLRGDTRSLEELQEEILLRG